MSDNEQAAVAVQKCLDVLRSVQSLDGSDKDFVEQLLETALRDLRGEDS